MSADNVVVVRSIRFEVLGKPAGKARARTVRNRFTGRVHSFTPDETMIHEAGIQWTYAATIGAASVPPADGMMFSLTVRAFYAIPKSMPKKWRRLAEADVHPYPHKPDWDNVGKLVSDALNGVCWKDDGQIVSATVEKWYSPRPRIEVLIREIRVIQSGGPQ